MLLFNSYKEKKICLRKLANRFRSLVRQMHHQAKIGYQSHCEIARFNHSACFTNFPTCRRETGRQSELSQI